MATIDDIEECLEFISNAYPSFRIAEGTASAWFALLNDIDGQKLMAATVSACRDGIPQPSMIRTNCFHKPRSPEFQAEEQRRHEAPLPGNLVPHHIKRIPDPQKSVPAEKIKEFREWLANQ